MLVMKTRIIFLAILNILIWNGVATAQNIYYQESGIINGDGFSFKCEVGNYGKVKLYNVNNQFTNIPETYKDGSKVPLDVGMQIPTREPNKNGVVIRNIINNILTQEEKDLMRKMNGMFSVLLRYDSESGKVVDVEYEFYSNTGIPTIPPKRFFEMEQELKRSITIVPTEVGRKLKYLISGWMHDREQLLL